MDLKKLSKTFNAESKVKLNLLQATVAIKNLRKVCKQ